MTIFEKIARREIPAEIVYEEEDFLVIRDLHPQAPVHVLVIPKRHIASLAHSGADDAAMLGHLLHVAAEVARLQHLDDGYRIVINTGHDGGQTVDHLHVHLLGGRAMGWPPG